MHANFGHWMKTINTLILMCLASLLSSCSGFSAPKAPIEKFSYNHDGTIGRNSFSWSVNRLEDGKGQFIYTNHLSRDQQDLTDTIPAALMDSLEAICRSYKVHRWDGYRGDDKRVCDGTGFSLYIRYADGRTVNAHGMNKFPKNYRAFRDELYALLMPVQERLVER